MPDEAISPLRRLMIEDMAIRKRICATYSGASPTIRINRIQALLPWNWKPAG